MTNLLLIKCNLKALFSVFAPIRFAFKSNHCAFQSQLNKTPCGKTKNPQGARHGHYHALYFNSMEI